jgi:hypothetical protein
VQNVVDKPIRPVLGGGVLEVESVLHSPTGERSEEHPHAAKEATVQRLLCSESIPGTGDRQPEEIRNSNRPLDNPISGEIVPAAVETSERASNL